MEFSCDFFEEFPVKYKEAVEILLKDIKVSENFKIQEKIFHSFSQIYTMVPDLWIHWQMLREKFYQNNKLREFRESCILQRRSFKHFCWIYNREDWFYVEKIKAPFYHKIIDYSYVADFINKFKAEWFSKYIYFEKILSESLDFPHSNLTLAVKRYKEYGKTPLNKIDFMKIEKLQKLYEKIVAAKADEKKWLDCLIEANDKEFVIQNIEYRLRKTPYNKRLWKLYLEHLSSQQNKEVLNLYKRYCRLFLEDAHIRYEYKMEIERFNKLHIDISKWYIDIIKFELQFGILQNAFQLLIHALNSISVKSKSFFKFAMKFAKSYEFTEEIVLLVERTRKRFAFSKWQKVDEPFKNTAAYCIHDEINGFTKRVFIQRFSLPKTLMVYIILSANFVTMNLLMQTCKYFVIKQKGILVWDLVLGTSAYLPVHFFKNSMKTHRFDDIIQNLKKIRVGRTLKIYGRGKKNSLFLSSLIPKLMAHEVRYLTLTGQIFKMTEFDAIIESEYIIKIFLEKVLVLDTNDNEIPLEKVLERFPNAIQFRWDNTWNNHMNYETSHKISLLSRNAKLKTFTIRINEMFDPIPFCKFIKDNIAKKAIWVIIIISPNEEFANQVENMFQSIDFSELFENSFPEVKVFHHPSNL